MNRRIVLINDQKRYDRMANMNSASIISAFGDRAYFGIDEGERYDAFISGFISDSNKILDYREIISDAKLDNERVLYLCDPVFADDGKKYDFVTDMHIDNYKKLMEISDIITPNLTEATFLTGMSYDDFYSKYSILKYENDTREKVDGLSRKIIESIFPLLDKIRFKKNQITVITGIELYNAILTILDVYDGDHGKRQTTCNYSEKIESRSGAGEIFDAMFFETAVNGLTLLDALSASTSFINNSLRYSRDKNIRKELGIFFEPILLDNVNMVRKRLSELQKEMNKNQNSEGEKQC